MDKKEAKGHLKNAEERLEMLDKSIFLWKEKVNDIEKRTDVYTPSEIQNKIDEFNIVGEKLEKERTEKMALIMWCDLLLKRLE